MREGVQPTLLTGAFDQVGLRAPVALAYRALQDEAANALRIGGIPADGWRTWVVPGRIEVMGKHVDYAGGRSLLCAVERGLVLVVRPRTDQLLVLRDARRKEALRIDLARPVRGAPSWSVYPRTVMHRLVRNFGSAVRGADIAMASNLPAAAGVSSSSALTVGLTLAVAAVSALPSTDRWRETITDRTALSGYVGAIENGTDFGALGGERGVGTMGGAQDQTAILCSAPEQLSMFRWAPVAFEQMVRWPADYRFVIAVSGVSASKTGGAKERYNRASRTAQHLVAAWNAEGRESARTLRDVFTAAAGTERVEEIPAALLQVAERAATTEFSARHLTARVEQFFDETFVLVPEAAAAIGAGALQRFGTLVDASQAGAERALENQVAETIHLQRYARELGAVAASAFGAGFGGSVWAMVAAADVERFTQRWREKYQRAHARSAQRAQFFETGPSVPAFEVVG